ncbi:Pyridine nucleotide-disulfide oxidoreductase, FAD/NAD(P)-binding domain containing protein [Desulfovibrio sp. X2]|uniref:NAD(P)/FAD-dependent oxidoreductase n=1 Tax=Desulfovibrio sp. X2 TaxID=941449 RepID=UPI000358C57A|nr:FAD-dependent oxidoreductase [Desulfovibrio sp. X2]EPR41425.1 Pyridine nucleotide-disulfide oxidoreductase, FAD/NAD(P)-binding domain containing protein [Desulfovibrio sp. X2]
MKYVIIGNGVASIGAIEGIRAHDKTGGILVLSEEERATYGRPLISYYLAGKVKADDMALRPESFYADNHVTVRLGCEVASVDAGKKAVVLANGERVPYEKLLLATGGAAGVANIPGKDATGVHTFTTWAHAQEMKGIAAEAKRFVVIGAGLIALKAAEGLTLLGKDVTLVVRSRIMRVYFDEEAGALVRRHLETKGLKFKNAAPKAVLTDASGRVTGVSTEDGDLPADCVIMATGVFPRLELARSANVTCNKGIVCDDHMRTSDADIFAAGDVAEALDMQSGTRAVTPIWPSAYNQGANAGANMAGADTPYAGGLAMNSIPFFGLGTISVGLSNPPADAGYEVVVRCDEAAMRYRKLVFKKDAEGDRLVGCILIGDVDHAGIYTGFIREGHPVSSEVRELLLKGEASPLDWPAEDFDAHMAREKVGRHTGVLNS